MKDINVFNIKRISFLLVGLIILLVDSCRKDFDDNWADVPINEPGNWIVPYVFPDKKLGGLEDNFAANEIKELGEGLGISELLKGGLEIGSLIFEIYEYKHTEARFDEIDDKLDGIKDQIEELDKKMKKIEHDLEINVADLTSFVATQNILPLISQIEVAYSDANIDGFRYYSDKAKAYKEDPTNPSNIANMEYLKSYVPTYAAKVYPGGSNSMANLIHEIYNYLCTDLGTGANALQAYAKTLILNSEGRIIDSTQALNTYLYFESYFLKIVNYQFQAATIYMNAAHFIDSTQILGFEKDYWKYFSNDITKEINYFLQMVDYLTVNMAEYRDKQRFLEDMKYADVGLAPDKVFYNVNARSQFVANMIYSALGIKPPVISGHILIPSKYTSDGSTSLPTLNLSIGSENIVASVNQSIGSMIPYTYWKNKTCHPDNNWLVYRFSADTNSVWSDAPQEIVVSNPPWPSNEDAKGSVTPLYYNPRNPSQTSKVKTDSCTFQFAYFSANWQWGYMYLSQTADNDVWGKNLTAFDTRHYNSNIYNYVSNSYSSSYSWANIPLGGNTTNKSIFGSGGYPFTDSKAIEFSHPLDNTGTMTANGNRTKADKQAIKHDYYFIVADYLIRNVYTGSEKPVNNNTSDDLEAWGALDGLCNTSGTHPYKIIVSMGTSCNHSDYGNSFPVKSLQGDILNTTFNFSSATSSFSSVGISKLSIGTPYTETGFGFYFEEYYKKSTSSLPLNIAIKYSYQFIYTGTYPLN